MRVIAISVMWYMAGLFLFYHMADFSKIEWQSAYYIWDKAKDLLFVSALLYNFKRMKLSLTVVFIFCVIRLLWEIVANITSTDINNSKVIDWIFVAFMIIWFVATIKELIEWQKVK